MEHHFCNALGIVLILLLTDVSGEFLKRDLSDHTIAKVNLRHGSTVFHLGHRRSDRHDSYRQHVGSQNPVRQSTLPALELSNHGHVHIRIIQSGQQALHLGGLS